MQKLRNEIAEESGYLRAEKEFLPLGLNRAAIKALAVDGIYSLRDLASRTEQDILVIPGIGERTFNRLKPYLRKQAPS